MHYRKAQSAKLAGYATVSSSVVQDFSIPPCAVVFWGGIAAGAAMPKTSVDEDGQFKPRNHQVWSPRQRFHIAYKSDFFGPHYFAHAPFCARPLGADSAHTFGDGF